MNYIGDFSEDSTIRIALTTNNTSGAAVAPSTAFEADDFRIYRNGSATQKTTTNGITCTSPFDSVTGLHTLEIDTSNDTGDSGFWTAGADYWVVAVPDETVASQTVVQVIAAFSIENRLRVKSTDQVSLAANATCTKLTDIESDTQDIQTRLPAALVSGRIDSTVGAYQTGLAPPTAAENGAAGWNRMLVDHTSSGTVGAAIGAIKTKTDNLPSDPADASDIAAEFVVVNAKLDAIDDFIDTEVLAIKARTDNLPDDPADASVIAASFTEIKGVGWSSATDTLEKIAESSGGAGNSIMVTPVVAQTPVRVIGSNIETFIGDLSDIRVGVFSGTDPVDLSTMGDLEVCVQLKSGVDLDLVSMADITIDGADSNYFSWTPNGESVDAKRTGKWSLRKASNKQVIAYGAWIVVDAALSDAS